MKTDILTPSPTAPTPKPRWFKIVRTTVTTFYGIPPETVRDAEMVIRSPQSSSLSTYQTVAESDGAILATFPTHPRQ